MGHVSVDRQRLERVVEESGARWTSGAAATADDTCCGSIRPGNSSSPPTGPKNRSI
ncbi:hypothetical protein [Micromonospora ureilytica]|uniref:hypothetical protein n=1 Tax=Micromonospora ureilytica TaxID=709868 RepID=UPI00403A6B3B